jgi:hypothetical protein
MRHFSKFEKPIKIIINQYFITDILQKASNHNLDIVNYKHWYKY